MSAREANVIDVEDEVAQRGGSDPDSVGCDELGEPRRRNSPSDPTSPEIVNRISPDTAIHEQNGYAKLLDHKYIILMTNVDNDNSDKTYTNMHEV